LFVIADVPVAEEVIALSPVRKVFFLLTRNAIAGKQAVRYKK